MRKWLGILLTAVLAACGSGSQTTVANQIFSNDFESLEGWLGEQPTPTLTTENAHSGTHSLVVKQGLDYSQSYINLLSRMSTSRPKKIKVIAWVFVPSSAASVHLVVEINDPTRATDKTLLWQSADLAKEVTKYNEWQQIEKLFDVPAAATATSQFKLYLWRGSSTQPVYLDDLTVATAN